jgi:hypothetical protein
MEHISSRSSTDNVSLLSENIINSKREPILAASRDMRPEVNAERTTCMILSSNQHAGQKDDMMVGNKSFKNMAKEICFGKTVTNQICIPE